MWRAQTALQCGIHADLGAFEHPARHAHVRAVYAARVGAIRSAGSLLSGWRVEFLWQPGLGLGRVFRLGLVEHDLAERFASLLLHEGRSVVYVARQLGHGANLTLSTYGHVIDEFEAAPQVSAEAAIAAARASLREAAS